MFWLCSHFIAHLTVARPWIFQFSRKPHPYIMRRALKFLEGQINLLLSVFIPLYPLLDSATFTFHHLFEKVLGIVHCITRCIKILKYSLLFWLFSRSFPHTLITCYHLFVVYECTCLNGWKPKYRLNLGVFTLVFAVLHLFSFQH